jgi:hypothetical protein
MSFLSAGFIALFKIRTVIREQGGRAKINKLEKLMVKIGSFSVMYIVPAGTVIACGAHELVSRPGWERGLLCPACGSGAAARPDFSVMMLRYFMVLAVGITSGFWVWSGKTVEAWGGLLARACGLARHSKAAAGAVVVRSALPLPAPPHQPR